MMLLYTDALMGLYAITSRTVSAFIENNAHKTPINYFFL